MDYRICFSGEDIMVKNAFKICMIIFLILLLPIHGILFRADKSLLINGFIRPRIQEYNQNNGEELVIYISNSFLAWGLDPTYARNIAFTEFGVKHNVEVTVYEFSGMVEALNTLINQKSNPQADIVIGLDSTMVSVAKTEGILKPLTSGINLENISLDLITALDTEQYLLPIDYGLIALIFDPAFINMTSYPVLNQLTFEDLLSVFGEDLALQDPTQSATGLNFLLNQIVFYEQILGLDWQSWWLEAKKMISIDGSWSDSWARVFDTKEKHIMSSYGTDPAYNAFFNYSFVQNGALIHHNSNAYGWLQIEGIGIIQGTSNETLAEEYVQYALSSDVQGLIATNNWMFPANNKTELPTCYDYAISTENVTILNSFITSDEIGENYQYWLNTWERLIYGTGLWWLWVLLSSLIILIGIVITIIIYKRRIKIDVE